MSRRQRIKGTDARRASARGSVEDQSVTRWSAFQDLVDALEEPSMVLRGDGVVLALNDSLVGLLGADRNCLLDRHLDLLFGCDVQDSYRLLRALFGGGQHVVVELSGNQGRSGIDLELDASRMKARAGDRAVCAFVRVRPAGKLAQRFRQAARQVSRRRRGDAAFRDEATLLEREIARLERMAHVDALTGLENRGSFDRHLSKTMAQARRDGTSLSLVLMDVDRFKRLNDAWGHDRGDEALRAVAAALAPFGRRPLDLVARVGGEELAIVLPDCSLRDGLATASRVRRAVEAAAIPHPDGVVTVSIGVAAASAAEPRTVEELFTEADQGLYEAKRAGRNRVCAGYAPDRLAPRGGRKNF